MSMPILNWIGKDKVINHHRQVPYRVLEPQYTYGEADSGNMLIHGDNLDALKALMPRYEGRIKLVYIDPPYNTGNEGWVYNDNVNDPKIKKWLGEVVGKEGEDLSRHDKWLCMMYPRLKLLNRLLAEDGAIFISIDDNEQASLRFICDEVYGSSNYINTIIWQKKFSRANDAQYLSEQHDFILLYAKNKASWKRNLLPQTEEMLDRFQNPDNDPRGAWQSVSYNCNKNADERPNLYYPITNPNTGEEVMPSRNRVWVFSKERHEENIKNNLVYWGANGKGLPRQKKFVSDSKGIVPTTWWDHKFAGENQSARKDFRSIFGEEVDFPTPKPSRLIERVIQIATKSDDIILDSFAGSGTTAHAILNMNKRDSGKRRFILVEMEDYAETTTAERVKRVIDGYGTNEGTGGGFSFYELGEQLLLEDGNLNENVPAEKIYEYVWYTETRTDYTPQEEDYFLGVRANTAYYFYYDTERVTTLDRDFLRGVKTKAGGYLIYADVNTLSPEEMDAANIRFKKIPRDITRL